MGRVIKAGELTSRLDPLGREGLGAVEQVLSVRTEASVLTRLARGRIVELAIAMASRIVGEVVSVDPGLIDRIYERALAEVGELVPVSIHVHPDDRAVSQIDELARRRGIEVTSDPTVGRAGCRVKAAGVVVDATVEAALEALGNELEGASHG